MSERRPHPAGPGDQDRVAGQARFFAEPVHRSLREVAARGCSPGARAAARGNGGFEEPYEPAVQLTAGAGVTNRLTHLVQDLVLADDRALQAGGDPNQVAGRAGPRLNLQTRVELWGCPESVELHPMAGVEQNPIRMGGDPLPNRAREVVTVVGVGSVGLDNHHPRALEGDRSEPTGSREPGVPSGNGLDLGADTCGNFVLAPSVESVVHLHLSLKLLVVTIAVELAEPERDRLESRRFGRAIESRFDVGAVHDFAQTTQGRIA